MHRVGHGVILLCLITKFFVNEILKNLSANALISAAQWAE
jgi:hypothetical protein